MKAKGETPVSFRALASFILALSSKSPSQIHDSGKHGLVPVRGRQIDMGPNDAGGSKPSKGKPSLEEMMRRAQESRARQKQSSISEEEAQSAEVGAKPSLDEMMQRAQESRARQKQSSETGDSAAGKDNPQSSALDDLMARAKDSQARQKKAAGGKKSAGGGSWMRSSEDAGSLVLSGSSFVDPSLLSQPGSGELLEADPRLITVELDKAPGISWSTDLSLTWPYVSELLKGGLAEMSGQVKVGDVLVAVAGGKMMGAHIGDFMDFMAQLNRTSVEFRLFRGGGQGPRNVQLLKDIMCVEKPPEFVTLTVKRPATKETDLRFEIPYGANLRDELIKRELSPYASFNKVTNCRGQQLCGTCFVDVKEGVINLNTRDLYEARTLQQNPDTYRLSCVAFVYGNITVELLPKRGADQWLAVGGPAR